MKARGQRPPGGQRSNREGAVLRRAGARREGGRRPEKTLTAAERRAAEVNAKRAPRPPRDPDTEREKIEARSLEQWIDEGALRAEATGAASRAAAPARTTRRMKGVPPEAAAAISSSARDGRRADVLTERLGHAQEALERERYDEARRLATSLLRELPASPPCTR